jgi:lysophospholipase L1-like esterase
MADELVTDEMRDSGTPAEVVIRAYARQPQIDPTCGVALPGPAREVRGTPKNRLVTIGDSLTQGFQSGAIWNTALSWPRLVARELGCELEFRFPHYPGPEGGSPLNLEALVRKLERHNHGAINWLRLPRTAIDTLGTLVELTVWATQHWRDGVDRRSGIPHNLAVWGWDLRDCLDWTADRLAAFIAEDDDSYWRNNNAKAAWRVLEPARDAAGHALTVFQAAAELGRQGTSADPTGPGIETLVVMLGSNNALGTIVSLGAPRWSEEPGYRSLLGKQGYDVWRPSHFANELAEIVQALERVNAQHVVLATVPHVTIAPLAHGVGTKKVRPGSRYFPFYCRPWVAEGDFDPREDRSLSAAQARAIDAAIDQYNEAIEQVVVRARRAGRDWYLLEVSGLLDRLAFRRYLDDPDARPPWWDAVGGAYRLPEAVAVLQPQVDSRFFNSDRDRRSQGGLFSLDGVHPTTIGYGLLAQEVIKVMQLAGVPFYGSERAALPRPGAVQLDFERLLELDTLMRQPPLSLSGDLGFFGHLDQHFDQLLRLFGAQFPWP